MLIIIYNSCLTHDIHVCCSKEKMSVYLSLIAVEYEEILFAALELDLMNLTVLGNEALIHGNCAELV